MSELITKQDLRSLNKASEQIHSAAQFLAMAGKLFSDKKNDDSHTNMGWLEFREKFISRPLGKDGKYFIFLHPASMSIGFLDDNNHLLNKIPLRGKSKDQVADWIQNTLKDIGIKKSESYKMDLHYKLPEYANMEERKFRNSPLRAYEAFSKIRGIANEVINEQKSTYSMAGETRTWPHHFDHAAYIPLEKTKDNKVTKSINMGLAIHDSMINEHYFYTSAWTIKAAFEVSTLKELSIGAWINESFKGAVLPLSELLRTEDSKEQENLINKFFEESTTQLLNKLKIKSIK